MDIEHQTECAHGHEQDECVGALFDGSVFVVHRSPLIRHGLVLFSSIKERLASLVGQPIGRLQPRSIWGAQTTGFANFLGETARAPSRSPRFSLFFVETTDYLLAL